MTAVAFGWMGISRAAGESYSPKWKFISWVAVICGFLFPFSVELSTPVFTVETAPAVNAVNYVAGQAHGDVRGESRLYLILFLLWFFGFAVSLARTFINHHRFKKAVRSSSCHFINGDIRRYADNLAEELGIRRNVDIVVTPLVASPMVTGIFTPQLILPRSEFTNEEYRWIFLHEFVHLKRRDMVYKILSAVCMAVHWFNPAIYLLMRTADKACEEACDERAMRDFDKKARISYCRTLLGLASESAAVKTAFSTQLYSDKKSLKQRMSSVLSTANRRKLYVLTAVIAVLAVVCGSLIGFNTAAAVGSGHLVETTTMAQQTTAYQPEGNIGALPQDDPVYTSQAVVVQTDTTVHVASTIAAVGDTAPSVPAFPAD